MRHNIRPRFTKVEIEPKTDIDKTIISLVLWLLKRINTRSHPAV